MQLEPHLRLDTNVYLYPIERESARQFLSFIQTFERTRRDEDMDMALRSLLVMLDYRARSEKTAAEANGRRIKGDFGRPGEYPAECEQYINETRYSPSSGGYDSDVVTLDPDEQIESPDSY